MFKKILVAIMTTAAISAQAFTIQTGASARPKAQPAFFTGSKPAEMNAGEATMKALQGSEIYKCQLVVPEASKTGSLSLKPKRGQ